MARPRLTLAVGALVLVAAAVLIPVAAHEGHNKPSGATFDPNAPKRVSEATAAAIGLATIEVDFAPVEDVVRLTGLVRAQPASLFAVAPAYAGVASAIPVQPGDRVAKGDLLVELESPEVAGLIREARRAESQVASLQIEAAALDKNAVLTEAEVQRLSEAGDGVSANLLAQRRGEANRQRSEAALRLVALEQARNEAAALRQQAEANGAAISQSGNADAPPLRPGVVRFFAPIDGVVLTRHAIAGAGISAGQAVLTVGDFRSVQIEGELPEGLVDRLLNSPGAKVRIRRGVQSSGDAVAEGTVRFMSPMIDPIKRTASLIVDADNPAGALRPGQFVDLAVVISANELAVVVPLSAIVKEGPLQYVYVKEGQGADAVYLKRDVATGVRDDRVAEITQGLVPGDIVVKSGAFSLSQLRGYAPGAEAPAAPATPSDGHGHSH